MMLAEFVKDRDDARNRPRRRRRWQIVRQAVASGVVVMRAGLYSNCVRLLPPLTMPEDMLREGAAIARSAAPIDGAMRMATRGQRCAAAARDQTSRADARPSSLYNGQRVLTQAESATTCAAQAVGVRDGRIAHVGTTADVARASPARRTRKIDLAGRTVVPGFNDAHAHIWKIGHLLTTMLDLRGVGEHRRAGERACRRSAPGCRTGAWLLGRGYNEAAMNEQRPPTRADLDRAAPIAPGRPHPHLRPHLRGEQRARSRRRGIGADTAAPAGGVIERDEPRRADRPPARDGDGADEHA